MTAGALDTDFTRHFRTVMGNFCSGITVISAMEDGVPVGFTCQSFFSVSLDPPLVAFSAAKTSTTFPRIRASATCCVNVLSAEQEPVSRSFARSGGDKWAGIAWHPSAHTRDPIVDGALAWVECSIRAEFDAGDHVIVLCDVLDVGCEARETGPLLYFRGRYGVLAESRPAESGRPVRSRRRPHGGELPRTP